MYKKSILIFGVIFSFSVCGMESGSCSTAVSIKKNIAISFDLDGVLNASRSFYNKIRVSDIMKTSSLIYELLSHHQAAMDWHNTAFNKVETLEKSVVDVVYPIVAMIECVRLLKRQGYTVIAATNQKADYHIDEYRVHMNLYSIDLNELFEGVLTRSRCDDAKDDCDDQPGLYRRLSQQDNIYVMCNSEHKKPDEKYYAAVKELAQSCNPAITQVIHIDDLEINVRGAVQSGLISIHFDVPPSRVLLANPEMLERAITNFKNDLKAHGIDLLQDQTSKRANLSEDELVQIKNIKISQEAMKK